MLLNKQLNYPQLLHSGVATYSPLPQIEKDLVHFETETQRAAGLRSSIALESDEALALQSHANTLGPRTVQSIHLTKPKKTPTTIKPTTIAASSDVAGPHCVALLLLAPPLQLD